MVQTPIVTLETAKAYLRVDSADEDALIGILLNSAEQLVMDVARLSSTDWTNIQKVRTDDDGNVISIHTTKLKAAEIAIGSGIEMFLINGTEPDLLYKLFEGERVGTHFLAEKE